MGFLAYPFLRPLPDTTIFSALVLGATLTGNVLPGISSPAKSTFTSYGPFNVGLYSQSNIPFPLLVTLTLASSLGLGEVTMTSTSPSPARVASTLKVPGFPATRPLGSIPGPLALHLL